MIKKKRNINRRFYKPCFRSCPPEERLHYSIRQDKSLDLFNYENLIKIADKQKKINQIKKNVKEFLEMIENQKKEVEKPIENHKLISALVALITADINEEISDTDPVVGHINLEFRPFGLKYCIQTITLTNNRIYQRLVTPYGVSAFKLISNHEVNK